MEAAMRRWWVGAVLTVLVVASCGRPAPLHVQQVPFAGGDILGVFGPASPLLAPFLPSGFALGGAASASADGRWLAYQAPAIDSWDIFLFDTATGQINPLSKLNSPGADVNPLISPDGSTITFLSDRNGFWDTFIYDRISGTYRPLTFSSFFGFGIPRHW
jgi:hypothetical protein